MNTTVENPLLLIQLNKIAREEGFINYLIQISPDSFRKYGLTTLLRRIIITGTKEGIKETKLNLICKTYPENEYCVNVFNLRNVFEREVYIYTKVLPEFSNFQRGKGMADDDSFFNFPKLYCAINDHESKNYLIILEDLSDNGYEVNSNENGLDFDHYKVALEGIAKLHALSYAVREQRPDLFEEIKRNTIDQFVDHQVRNNSSGDSFKQCVVHALKELEMIEPSNSLIIERFKNLVDNLFVILRECVSIDTAEPFCVLTHGDLHAKNLMFKYEENQTPTMVNLIDWQLSRFASPALDLSLLLFTLTSKDFRDRHYDELISHYYNELVKSIERLGSKAEQVISFNDIQSHLKKFGKFGFVISLGYTMWGNAGLEYMAEHFEEIIEKMANEMNQSMTLLPTHSIKLLVDAIRDAFDKEYF